MKIENIETQQLLKMVEVIIDYRNKLQINSTNLADLIAFISMISDDRESQEKILNEMLKLDSILSKAQMHYSNLIEEMITKSRTLYNIRNNSAHQSYAPWMNEILENDVDAFNHVMSVIEHKVDHRFPVLNVDSHSKKLGIAMSPGDPYYIISKPDEFNEQNEYNDGLFKSLKNYTTKGRFLEASSKLPQDQFGLILSTQNFNSIGVSVLSTHLIQCYKLLRPGGILLISFIDVLSEGGFEMLARYKNGAASPQISCLTKNYFFEYLLKPIKDRAPFIIHDEQTFLTHTVLSLRKPGELKTVKNRKTIGAIKTVTN